MSARLIDGRALSRRIRTALRDDVAAYTDRHGGPPCMVAIGSAAEAVTDTYLTLKLDAARSVGIRLVPVLLASAESTSDAVARVQRAADDPTVHGIFVQYPLPAIDTRACNGAIPLEKDIDGANPQSLPLLRSGADVFAAASAVATMELLAFGDVAVAAREVFVGHGAPAIAEPLVVLLEQAGALVRRVPAPAGDEALRAALLSSDVALFPAGLPRALLPEWLPDAGVVIDGGYFGPRRSDDVLARAASRLAAYVPARGGVGPVTVDVLLRHTLRAASKRAGTGGP